MQLRAGKAVKLAILSTEELEEVIAFALPAALARLVTEYCLKEYACFIERKEKGKGKGKPQDGDTESHAVSVSGANETESRRVFLEVRCLPRAPEWAETSFVVTGIVSGNLWKIRVASSFSKKRGHLVPYKWNGSAWEQKPNIHPVWPSKNATPGGKAAPKIHFWNGYALCITSDLCCTSFRIQRAKEVNGALRWTQWMDFQHRPPANESTLSQLFPDLENYSLTFANLQTVFFLRRNRVKKTLVLIRVHKSKLKNRWIIPSMLTPPVGPPVNLFEEHFHHLSFSSSDLDSTPVLTLITGDMDKRRVTVTEIFPASSNGAEIKKSETPKGRSLKTSWVASSPASRFALISSQTLNGERCLFGAVQGAISRGQPDYFVALPDLGS